MSRWLNLFPRGLQWWYAKRAGERPACEECGSAASWIHGRHGPVCVQCEEQRTESVGMLREIEPRDYLDD